MDSLRQMLDTQTARAQNSESSSHAIAAENAAAKELIEDLRQRLDTETTRAHNSESTKRRIEAENTTAKETVKNLKERFEALQWRKGAESDGAKEPLGGGQPESGVVPEEATAGGQDTVDVQGSESKPSMQCFNQDAMTFVHIYPQNHHASHRTFTLLLRGWRGSP